MSRGSTAAPQPASADGRVSSDIGEIPPDWSVVPLGDVFDVQQGKALSPSARIGAAPRPFLRTANVLWGRLDLTVLDKMDFTPDEVTKLALRRGDLLVCEGGEIGRTAVWKDDIDGCLYQNHLHRLRANTPKVVPAFVMYWLQAAFLHLSLYGGIGNKTTIPNLSGARLKQLPIPLPPVEEEGGIAHVLDRLQHVVGLQGRIVATLRELKAVAMAKLFREGLRREPLKLTEIGEIPQAWSVMSLGELASAPTGLIQTGPFGSQLHAADYVENGIPIVNPTHIDNGRVTHKTIPRVSSGDATRLERHSLKIGDILFSRRGDVGRHAYVSAVESGWLCGTGCLLVRPSVETMDPLYLNYALSTDAAQEFLKGHATGTIMPNINTKILSAVPLPVPPREDQEAIAAALRRLDAAIWVANRRREMFSSRFSSMLSLLMTGQLRVPLRLIHGQAPARLEGKPAPEVIKEIVRRIVEAVAPERIILFGSAARGEMRPDSDLDLLVVKACDNRREVARAVRACLRGVAPGRGKDVVVVTPEDVERDRDTIGYIIRPALREGCVLYVA